MADELTEVDVVILGRWADAVSFREALGDLEERLASRLNSAVESLRPWFDEQGYGFLEIETKYARVNVARTAWLNKKKQPSVWFTLDAILPFGFRKVQDERVSIAVDSRNLEREDRNTFREHLANRLSSREGGWLNEDCTRDHPAVRYVTSHGERERLALVQTPDGLATFIRESLSPILLLGDDTEAALRATLGK